MNVKKKGNAGENKFANWMQEQGIAAYRNSSSGANHRKSDVHNAIDLNIEVKTVKKINLQEAWRQTTRDASMASSTPLLSIHFDGMGEDEWLIVINNYDWIELQKKAMAGENKPLIQPPSEVRESRELKWAVSDLKRAAAKVERLMKD